MFPSHLMIVDQHNRYCPPISIPPYPYNNSDYYNNTNNNNHHHHHNNNRHQVHQNYHQDNGRGQLLHFNGNQNRQYQLIQNQIHSPGLNRRMIVENLSSRRPGGFSPAGSNSNLPNKNWQNNKINYNNSNSNSKNYNKNSVATNARKISSSGSSNCQNSYSNNNNSYHNNNYNNGGKKQNYNRSNKRNMQRGQLQVKEINNYGSDSGFSSRSPTPSKHDSQTESSDDRESVASSAEPDTKKFQRTQSSSLSNTAFTSRGFINNTNQCYPNQHTSYYPNTSPTISLSTSQLHQLNYQGKKSNHTADQVNLMQNHQEIRKSSELSIYVPGTFPRSYWAPDRYLARADTIAVMLFPSELIRNSIWDNLSKSIWNKFYENQQSQEMYVRKLFLWKYLLIYIKAIYPRYSLFLVGSTMNGFGANTSDVDICLVVQNTEMINRDRAISHLEEVETCLSYCDFIQNLKLIHAKVPILKFRDGIQNLEVDLNCNNAVGVRNTHMLHCYSRIDWRVRPLVLVVKLWAQAQDINDAKNMTISSYSLVLMVIHFLQCGVTPAVLPCLQELFKDKFKPNSDIHTIDINEDMHVHSEMLGELNHQPLGELFYQFYKYYVNFDFDKYAVSVRLAKQIPIEECRYASSFKNDPSHWNCLCIEEPFDLTNTARSVYDAKIFEDIKEIFKLTCETLERTRSLESVFTKLKPQEQAIDSSKS